MLKVCDGCKDGLDTDQDGSKWGALAPFRADGAHPSYSCVLCFYSACLKKG